MKVSIITVCYNAVDTIEDTIKSVLDQTYTDVEYIIIDGGSTDGTLDVIAKYKDRIARVVSEDDNGIYDAMNKGLRLAAGDVVGIINADDFYHTSDVLKKVVTSFTIPDVQLVYGNLAYVDRKDTNKRVRFWKAGTYYQYKLWYGWALPHPTMFVRKSLYDTATLFRTDFSIAADYELMLRWLLKEKVNPVYLNETITSMREGGTSARNIMQRIKGWGELYRAWWVNRRIPPVWLVITRPLSKLTQYIV